jgi:hypothetical protein
VPERSYLEALDEARAGVADLSNALPAGFAVRPADRDAMRLVRRGDEWFAIYRVELPLGRVRIDQPGGERSGSPASDARSPQ